MVTPVQSFPTRSVVSEEGGTLRIALPMERIPGVVFFLGLWLAGWSYGLVQVSRTFMHRFEWTGLSALSMMIFGELIVTFVILRALAGWYIVAVDPPKFTVRRQVLGIGWTEQYAVADIRNLRFRPAHGVGQGRQPSRIVFDHGKKTAMFGSGLDESEADYLISLIAQRIPARETSTPDESAIRFWQGR